MNEKSVPPVFAPEPDQPQGAPAQGEGRSAYGGMSAQETVDAYLGRLRSIKAQSIALVIANAVAMVWFIERGTSPYISSASSSCSPSCSSRGRAWRRCSSS